MDKIEIQYQDASGSWRTINSVINQAQIIQNAMKAVKSMKPAFKVRAINSFGSIVDMYI